MRYVQAAECRGGGSGVRSGVRLEEGSVCVFDDIVLNSLQSLREVRVCVRALPYLGRDKTHGPHIGQAK